MSFEQVNFVLALAATTAFAVTGVMAVVHRRVDFFSAIVLGVITAVGGGTIRDLILDVPVFWSTDLFYVRIAVLASIVTFISLSFFSRPQIYKAMLYVDGLGAAMFGVGGAFKCYELDFAWPLGPLILGVITAIGGGLLRDVLSGNKTLLMSDEVYAVPVAIGCVLMLAILMAFPTHQSAALVMGTVVACGLRFAAIYWELRLPNWFTTQVK